MQGFIDDEGFEKFLALVFLLTGVLFLFDGASVIVIDVPGIGASAFADHRCAAVTAERLALQLVADDGFCGGRGLLRAADTLLNALKCVGVYNWFAHPFDGFTAIAEQADIRCVGQHGADGVDGHFVAETVSYAALVESIDNLFLIHALCVLREDVAGVLNVLFVYDNFFVLNLVSHWDTTAAELLFRDAFALSALDVLREVCAVILRHCFQQTFKDDSFGGVRDVFLDGHDADAAGFQLVLVERAVIAAAGEAVELPNDDHLKLALLRVANHPQKLWALVFRTRQSAVDVFSNDGDSLLLSPCVVIAKLPFDGLFVLGV